MINPSLLTDAFERCGNCEFFTNGEMTDVVKIVGFGFCIDEEAFKIHKFPVIHKRFHCNKFLAVS